MDTIKEYITNFVISKDGTKIHYRQLGSGPGLLLVHGGLMYSKNFMVLAKRLSNDFTVYVPDRCGRGLSGTHDCHSPVVESEDMQAILDKTNTQYAFGLSSGAVIVLQTALLNSTLKKIALFEPPIPVDNSNIFAWTDHYKQAMSEGNYGKAFISIIKGTGDSSLMKALPSFITAPLINFAIKLENNKSLNEHEVSFKSLLEAMQFDIEAVKQSHGIIEKCKNLTITVLLLGGQKSQQYLKDALDTLNTTLPHAKQIEFPNTGHLAADNSGKPEIVANELRLFFSESA